MASANAKAQDLAPNTYVPPSGPSLTTDYGVLVSDTDSWLKAAASGTGPSLLEDPLAREKIHHFDHEPIPERVVHARGTAAHGYFRALNSSAEKYTFAPVLTDSSRKTPVFLRFSTVAGSRGSADTVRDVRGFAVKFYTKEGNWDLVGNDIPVFFIQDAIKFPDIVHAVKPEPHNEVPQAQSAHNNFWDFVGLLPEAAHMVMWVMSDRAIPRSFRMMQGFGVNTYTLINANGERHFVKFHWIPELGVHSLVWDEALKLAGQDPDFHRKDLEEAINSGCPPKWTLAIQVIPESSTEYHTWDFDILDATKVWPEELVPLQNIGELVLDRVVDEFFPETEQVAFCTSHIVPGIGFSDDPLLQGRNFSYFDTQISRLGINWEQIPINRPVCPVVNFHRGGKHQERIIKSNVNYWPNRHSAGQPAPPVKALATNPAFSTSDASKSGYAESKQPIANGAVKQRSRGEKFKEHYKQAQLFYNSLTDYEKKHIIDAMSFELDHCDDPVVPETFINKVLVHVDYNLAKTVAQNVGASIPDENAALAKHTKTSPPLSQLYYAPKTPTIATRRIAILIDDGFDYGDVSYFSTSMKAAGAVPFIIGPRRGIVKSNSANDGDVIHTDHHFEGQRSTMFDALLIPSGGHTAKLAINGRVQHWIREAFGHCKVIGAIGSGAVLVDNVLNLPASFNLKVSDAESTAVQNSFGVVSVGKHSNTLWENIKEKIGVDVSFLGVFVNEVSKHRCYERELKGLTNVVAY